MNNNCRVLYFYVIQIRYTLYNFLLSALAFAIEWKQSWGWPRFDTNLLCFVMEIMLEKYELA